MVLIKCPEFHKEVSDKAPTCPHCGCPLSKNLEVVLDEKASAIIERNHEHNCIGGIITGALSIIAGIVMFCCSFVENISKDSSSFISFIITGIILVILGIFAVAYSTYRLKNY